MDQAQQAMELQGQTVDSKNEFYLGSAFEKLKIPYIYQYSILGGRSRRGGYVLDFLLTDTAPGPTAVNIQGAYWHRKNAEEAYEQITIQRYCEERGMTYLEIGEAETESAEAAMNTAKGLR